MSKKTLRYGLVFVSTLLCFVLGGAAVAGAASWASVAAGTDNTVAIKTDGTLWAWGWRCGAGRSYAPARVGTATNWKSVSLTDGHAVLLKTDGSLWAWGNNAYGQLGDGTTTSRSAPVRIGTATDWKSVAAGFDFTLATKADGTLWAWGDNFCGQLGDGTTTNRRVPTRIGAATDWKTITAGAAYSLAIKTDGTLWAWGSNTYGQLGDGTTTDRYAPKQVGTATDWKTAAASYTTLAIKNDGSLWAWGYNCCGQIGDGSTTERHTPVHIGAATDWQSVSVSFDCSLAVKTDKTLWAWGYNCYGEFGNGTSSSAFFSPKPARSGKTTNWKTVVAGYNYALGIKTDASLWAWGSSPVGGLGIGTTNFRPSPTLISDVATPQLVSAVNAPTGVKFSWRKVSGASGYYVYRKTGTGSWTKVATVASGSSVSYTDTKAASGATYLYTARAYKSSPSALSDYDSLGKKVVYVATPKLASLTNSKSGPVLKWKKVSGASGYIVYRKKGSGGWAKLATLKSGASISYTDKKAAKGTTYAYTVRAYKSSTANLSSYNTTGLKIKVKK